MMQRDAIRCVGGVSVSESCAAVLDRWGRLGGKYYEAYSEYLQRCDGVSGGGVRAGDGSARVGAGVSCVEPPVWVGLGVVRVEASGFGADRVGVEALLTLGPDGSPRGSGSDDLGDGRGVGEGTGLVAGSDVAAGSGAGTGLSKGGSSVDEVHRSGDDGGRVARVDGSERWRELSGRARRKAKRRAKAAVKEDPCVSEGLSGVEVGPVEAAVAEVAIPEWRVKNPRAQVHKGYFSECSAEKQRELRETRAAMLVAKNKAEAVRAEAEARRLSAQMKSQEIERGVELRRLETEAKLKTAVESKFGVGYSSGFAKTIISEGLSDIIPVPSLDGSGSVSPDSSVSVAMVRRLEKALQNVSEKLAESEKKLGLLSKSKGTAGAPEVQGSVPKGFRGIITVSPAEEAAMFDRMHAAEHMSCHDGLTQYAAAQLAGEVPNEPLGAWGPRGA